MWNKKYNSTCQLLLYKHIRELVVVKVLPFAEGIYNSVKKGLMNFDMFSPTSVRKFQQNFSKRWKLVF